MAPASAPSTTMRAMRSLLAVCIAALLSACATAAPRSSDAAPPQPGQVGPWQPSAASRWLDVLLEATAREVDRIGARPTILSRTMALALEASFDAWAAYTPDATPTAAGEGLRRPPAEWSRAHQEQALAFALARVVEDLQPQESAFLAEALAREGYDPAFVATDPSTPAGLGNLVAQRLMAARHRDGANQLGDEVGANGKPYADWTFYRSVSPPERIVDPNHWQPIPFDDGKGGKVTPGFLTPHWYRVTPLFLERSSQFRAPPPPTVDKPELRAQTEEVVQHSATLDARKKAIVEFMRDGPRSTGQSGHWLRFAQEVSRRDHHDLRRDVTLYFAVAATAFDAFIACWETKRFYDTSRPYTLTRFYLPGQPIQAWGGPGQGTVSTTGDKWLPYSPSTFVTPPFPGYVSGHSTVSAACARTLEHFTGSDRFGIKVTRHAGELTEPGPHPEVELELPTFTATAEMAGQSRVMGGYHVQVDNTEGLALGRRVAEFLWPRMAAHFAPAPAAAATPAP